MRAVARGFALWAAVMAVTVGGGLLTRHYLPGVDGTVRALLVVELMFALVLLAAPFLGSWRELGITRPAEWRERRLLLVPLVIALLPLLGGVDLGDPVPLMVLVVGYALTGVVEELVWRGVAPRLLAPLGPTRAVLLGSALFGLSHLANALYRDSTGLVLAQAWGAFCFGVGYAALRLRTGTIVPLVALHALTDLAAAVGGLPKIPVLVVEDVVLLGLGIALLARTHREDHRPVNDHRARLERALHTTGSVVAAVRPDLWGSASPCAGWTVRDEANHLVGGLRIFAGQLTGTTRTEDHDGHDWLGACPVTAYDEAAAADLAAWHRPGAMGTTFDLAFGAVPAPMALVVHLTEVVVHGADLAVAVGREDLVDQEQAAWLLAVMRELGTDQFRAPGIFGPEVAAPEDALPHRDLLAFLGRELAPVPA